MEKKQIDTITTKYKCGCEEKKLIFNSDFSPTKKTLCRQHLLEKINKKEEVKRIEKNLNECETNYNDGYNQALQDVQELIKAYEKTF